MSNRRSIPTGYLPPLRQIAGQIRCASGFTFDPKRGIKARDEIPAPSSHTEARTGRPPPPDAQRVLEALEAIPDGSPLPSQKALCFRLRMARQTLVDRLQSLQDQGKIVFSTNRNATSIRLVDSCRVLMTKGRQIDKVG